MTPTGNPVPRKMYKIRQFAELINYSPTTVKRMILSGEINAVRRDKKLTSPWQIPASELPRWIESRSVSVRVSRRR